MLAGNDTALRGLCARILGWGCERAGAIEHAIRSLKLAADQCSALVVMGNEDLVPVAYALHRRMRGDWLPFIVADPRRGNTSASVRSPANYVSGLDGLQAARGGALCVRSGRLPRDFAEVVEQVRAAMVRPSWDPTDSVQLIVCARVRIDRNPFIVLPVPIRVPPLATRTRELPRIIEEYARDAMAALAAPATTFTMADHQWVLDNASRTLGEIEKATLRLVALKISESVPRAAERLRMAPVSLSRWIDRRAVPPPIHYLEAPEQETAAP